MRLWRRAPVHSPQGWCSLRPCFLFPAPSANRSLSLTPPPSSPVKYAQCKNSPPSNDDGLFLVEVTGLEPTTSWSLTKRATKLRYTSIKSISYYINYSLCVKRFFCPQTKFLAKSQILNVMRPHVKWGALYSEKTSRRTCKPGSVERGHLSTLIVTDKFKRYSRLHSGGQPCVNTAQPCIGRGLHGTGRYRPVGELLPRLSILTAVKAAVYFCCTFLKVAFT